MATNSRSVVIDDPKLKALAAEKERLVLEGRQEAAALDELAKQHKEGSEKIQKKAEAVNEIKRKILKGIGKHLKKMEIGEFENFRTTEIQDGQLVVVIVDEMKDFIDDYKSKDKFDFLQK